MSVLRPDDGKLEVIGEIDGLGKDERIYSVRFMGDIAYLVTFRQIDPLFTIDLSDPVVSIVGISAMPSSSMFAKSNSSAGSSVTSAGQMKMLPPAFALPLQPV